ncbi:VOC family protein, partial [Chloroflexota bacterium]
PDGLIVELLQTINHLARTVSDMDKSMAFYQDILGLKVFFIRVLKGRGIEEGMRLPGADLRAYHMGLDENESVELFSFMHPKGKQQQELRLCDVGCSYVAFDVDNVQQAYEEFQSKGAKFISRPVHPIAERPEITMVYMLDPDNYVVELRCGEALIG